MTAQAKFRLEKLTDKQYRDHPAISRSDLLTFMKSPQIFHAQYVYGRGNRETDAMKFGTQFHTHLLEPEKFNQQYFVYKKIPWNTKEGHIQRDDIADRESSGTKCLTSDEHQDIVCMNDSFRLAVPATALNNPLYETCAFWIDLETGIELKAKFDILDSSAVWDIKTAADICKEEFSWAIYKYKLYIQVAFYLDGATAATGKNYDTFIFAAFEKEAPYGVATYTMFDIPDAQSRIDIDLGRTAYKAGLRKLKKYFDNDYLFITPREICMPEKAREKAMEEHAND
jgi:hypothetical protein